MRRVVVAPPDPAWPGKFAAEDRLLRHALSPYVLNLHHIGSTSIPGIFAKPVIDILAEVTAPEDVDLNSQPMVALGYEAMGEFGIPERRYFRKNNPEGIREFQVHAFKVGSPHVDRHLAFRDYMRAHPDAAQAYSRLKQGLAREHPHSLPAYMDGKHDFIQDVEKRALEWVRKKAASDPSNSVEAGD